MNENNEKWREIEYCSQRHFADVAFPVVDTLFKIYDFHVVKFIRYNVNMG